MATRSKKTTAAKSRSRAKTPPDPFASIGGHCHQPDIRPRELPPSLPPGRARLIRLNEKKWANHTVLHYCFLDSPSAWRGSQENKDAVRRAFTEWKEVPIGLDFVEVTDPGEA